MRALHYFVLVIMLLIVFVVAYAIYISFSEHRQYSVKSLDYFLLTPKELSMLSKECKDNPAFVYSSADGPKPTIITLNCTISARSLDEQMRSSGFEFIDGVYHKKGVQIQSTYDAEGKFVVSVVQIGDS